MDNNKNAHERELAQIEAVPLFARLPAQAKEALLCQARKRVYAKAFFYVRDSTGQSVRCHIAPLDRSRIVRFSLPLATSRL